MCGIAGVLGTSGGQSADELRHVAQRMASTLRHRGPDDGGTWVDAAAGIAFGHRRLSIIDLSDEGHQPMTSSDGRWTLMVNGEIYNFPTLRRDLERHDYPFRGSSDTEVLLAAVATWGLARAVDRAIGMFAIAAWDGERRELHLVRDRLGEKPLYYGWAGDAFLFGSELKALRAYPSFRPDVDRDAVALFLRCTFIPSPHTIYEGVRKLPPGTRLTISADRPKAPIEPVAYWSLAAAAEAGARDRMDGASPTDAVDALEGVLADAVVGQLRSDVPLGAFLSGGIDSSIVVALAQAHSTRPIRTFTVGFDEPKLDEAGHARAVAAHLGTDHTEVRLTPQAALDAVPTLPDLWDEPFADPSQLPTALIARVARQHVTVCLSGDGGDEVFGGYNRYVLGGRAWARLRLAPRPLRMALARCLSSVWGSRSRVDKAAAVLNARDSDGVYIALASQWREPDRLVLGGREPATLLGDPDRWPPLGPVERWLFVDGVTALPDDMLTKVDRASMAVGLEARVPLLDHRAVELAWRLPLDLKIRDGQGKWILRRVLARYVPPALFERPKAGFDPPIGAWLRRPLRDWAESLLDARLLERQALLDHHAIRRAWDEHLRGRRNHDYRLWAVLMLQAWLDANALPPGRDHLGRPSPRTSSA